MVMEHNFTSIDGSSLGYKEELASTILGTEASSSCDNPNLKSEKLEPIAVIGSSAKFPQDASSPGALLAITLRRSMQPEAIFFNATSPLLMPPFFQYRELKPDLLIHSSVAYWKMSTRLLKSDPGLPARYQASGSGSSMLSNRWSCIYDFIGPSITIDTACSSSLTALHLACQSARCRESSMAIVAGCNLIMNPDTVGIPLSNLNSPSSDSRCYSFDHRANGYSRGECFGVVIIKALSEAVRDGHTVRALFRATGCGQDGKTPGLTQPSKDA
ncbi:hypothetical protein MMC29_005304 [Sticta canariensis]|nr:hypothetical protein [Sticta canariensis]